MKEKKIILFDLDGTVFEDFLKADKEYIEKTFKKKYLVLLIDKIARVINSFDILSNNMKMLKLRLLIYSLFSFKKYNKVLEDYENWYIDIASSYLKNKTRISISRLKDMGFNIIIISNNSFASKISLNDICLVTPKSKKSYIKTLFSDISNNICYFVGNNYIDDICTAKKCNVKSIYVGKSKFVSKKANYAVISLKQAIDLIIQKNRT